MEDDRLSPLKRFMRACAVAAGVCTCFASLAHTAKDSVAIQNSIDQYNAGTMKFDRFWNTYHDSAVSKIFLKQNGENHVRTTLDQAMEYIRATHDYSGGMHQIVYLVGWQYDGHDSKYPSWGSVGGQCKSSFSQDPRESLRAMMREARKYNADVSLHINMNDAYASSPLWKVYVDNDLICRGKNGNIIKGRVFGGEQSYPISHLKEWRSGFAKKRIQELLELLPELKDTRTIHIDALFGNESPGDKITFKDDIAAIDECTKYWHEIGFDVTTEFLPAYDQIGYFPYFYHLNLDERHKVLYPPTLICGGTGYSLRSREDYYNKHWQNTMPNAGCIYEEAWGAAHWGDRMGRGWSSTVLRLALPNCTMRSGRKSERCACRRAFPVFPCLAPDTLCCQAGVTTSEGGSTPCGSRSGKCRSARGKDVTAGLRRRSRIPLQSLTAAR